MAGIAMASSMLNAQKKSGVIMKVDGDEVPTEEFIYLYQKNNLQQSEPQTIDEYLPVFEDYRLKVAEAKSLGVDTMADFRNEVAQYRKDLLEPYISDTLFFEMLVAEALEREKTQVESSHIMIIRTNNEQRDSINLALLDSLRVELLNGADFIELAKKYSQDRFSSDKGGYLGFTPAGTFPYGFETAVYETPEGEISEIVESHVGWHIVKAGARKPAEDFNRPMKTYEEVKAEVSKKVSTPFDARYHKIRKNLISNLKAKHPELVSKLEGLSEDEAYELLILAEEDEQYANNQDYRNLVDEYTNGSLLFVVSVENVWDKASNDREGLENYFLTHRENYKWDAPHAKGVLVQALNDSVMDRIKLEIADMPVSEIPAYVKKNHGKAAKADKFNLKQGANPIVDNIVFGEETNLPAAPFQAYFVVDGRIIDQPEELDDVRGAVIGDYQELLEKEWVRELRARHTLEVNQKELDRIKKNYK